MRTVELPSAQSSGRPAVRYSGYRGQGSAGFFPRTTRYCADNSPTSSVAAQLVFQQTALGLAEEAFAVGVHLLGVPTFKVVRPKRQLVPGAREISKRGRSEDGRIHTRPRDP